MSGRQAVTIDPLLARLLAAPAADADALIEALVVSALHGVCEPILRGVTGLDAPDVFDDLRADVSLRLVACLRALRAGEVADIASFRDYAAMVTYHAYGDCMRRRFPRRARLKNRIRYVLDHDHRFTVSARDEGGSVSFAEHAFAPRSASPAVAELTDACAAVLRLHGKPLAIDALVTAVAERLGEIDVPDVAFDAGREPAVRIDTAERIESRDYLRRLWSEIVELPPRQRAALLLNLRDADGASVVRLLPVTGIASIGAIAAALSLAPLVFAELWQELPLPDDEIAERLGVTRQQVINLRKSARDRLARRMARAR